jgi:hypothetical protein
VTSVCQVKESITWKQLLKTRTGFVWQIIYKKYCVWLLSNWKPENTEEEYWVKVSILGTQI